MDFFVFFSAFNLNSEVCEVDGTQFRKMGHVCLVSCQHGQLPNKRYFVTI